MLPSRSPRRRSTAALLAVPALALPLLGAPALVGTAAAADVPTLEPDAAAAGFLVRAQAEDGSIGGSYGSTADSVVALVAAGYGRDAVVEALENLRSGVDAYAQDAEGRTLPGAVGKLLQAFVAAEDEEAPVAELVDRLLATEEESGDDVGRYTAPPTVFDGVTYDNNGALTQALALLGLTAAEPDAVSDAAVDWLQGQQCADGGFQYAVRTAEACSGDSNATAYAVQALVAAGDPADVGGDVAEALDFLDTAQTPDGGFTLSDGAGAGAESDANSTALARQAILAAGQDPTSGRWREAGGTPLSALVALQEGCPSAVDVRGSFPGFFDSTAARAVSTSQATPALAGQPLPVGSVDPAALSADTPVLACDGLAPRDVRTNACPPGAVPDAGFTDVPRGGTFTLAIDCVAAAGVARGTGDGSTFSPSADVTRAQMAVFVYRLLTGLGLEVDTGDAGFTDLTGVRPEVRDAVNALANEGVVFGTTETTYSPDASVRRDQMASFLVRGQAALAAQADLAEAGVAPFPSGVDTFADDQGNVHETAINALARAGVTAGAPGSAYDPARTVSRQQMAAFLARQADVVLQQLGEQGPELP